MSLFKIVFVVVIFQYRFLRKLFKGLVTDPSGILLYWRGYDRSMSLAHIVNCRLKKIISLSSPPFQIDQILTYLSREERILYNDLFEMIGGWRSSVLKEEEDNE